MGIVFVYLFRQHMSYSINGYKSKVTDLSFLTKTFNVIFLKIVLECSQQSSPIVKLFTNRVQLGQSSCSLGLQVHSSCHVTLLTSTWFLDS